MFFTVSFTGLIGVMVAGVVVYEYTFFEVRRRWGDKSKKK